MKDRTKGRIALIFITVLCVIPLYALLKLVFIDQLLLIGIIVASIVICFIAILHLSSEKVIQSSQVLREIDNYNKVKPQISTTGTYDATFKTIIFGDAGCGKTMLTQKFLMNLFVSDSKMTIGVDFEVKTLILEEQKVKLQIWDFGGEERFRFLLPTYVRGARGGIFVYDTTNYSSIASIDKWLKLIRKEIREEDQFPILVVGIIADEKKEKQISTEKGMKIAKSRNLNGFIECNITTGKNVAEVFELITELMLKIEDH